MPLPRIEPERLVGIADVLRAHGAFGPSPGGPKGTEDSPADFGDPGPTGTLARLFVGRTIESAPVVDAAIAPTSLDEWCDVGLLERNGDEVRAELSIHSADGILVASDWSQTKSGGPLPDDFVMGLSASTFAMARLAIRGSVDSVLDVGAGGGYQSLVAAGHARRVLAIDINERALRIAELNAALNALGNIETRAGDLLDPVTGEQFDRIVSNLPFVIGPDISQQFLTSGRAGEGLIQEFAQRAPEHLVEGGYCQFLANWLEQPGGDWTDHVRPWFEGSGCDVWVVRARAERVDRYAATWIGAIDHDPNVVVSRHIAWMEYFARLGTDAVSLGFVTMRKRTSASNWLRFDDRADILETGSGPEIERFFALQTWAMEHDNEALLDTRLRLSDVARVRQSAVLRDGAWENESMTIERSSGIPFSGEIDPTSLRVLSALDGRRTVFEALRDVAGGMVARSDAATLSPTLRQLVTLGLLDPV